MGALWTMVVTDLRQRAKDGSVLIFGLLVPFGLMFAMNLIFSGLDDGLEPVTVSVSAPADDQLAGIIPEVLGQIHGDGFDLTVERVDAGAVQAAVDGSEGPAVGVVVPDGFGADVLAGRPTEVALTLSESAGLEGQVVASVVDGILAKLGASAQTMAAAQELGAQPQQLAQLGQALAAGPPSVDWREGTTSNEQLSMSSGVVAGQAGLFLLFTVGFGVLGLIVEREWGTLARLASMPIAPWLIVVAKVLVGLIMGVVATMVLLALGTVLFDGVDFGSWPVVLALVLLVCAAAASLMFVIARLARTAEQAQIAQAIVAITLGMAGGAFFPMALTGWAADLMLLNPVAALTRGLGITSGGGGLADLGQIALLMGAFTVVALAVGGLLGRRKELL